ARERIFVANHDDAVADAVRVPLEILAPAQAEVEHFRHDARRRCRPQKWRALDRTARRRTGQLRHPAPPTRIVHGIVANLRARHGREPLPGQGQRRSLACRTGDAAAQIAQRLEIRPHQRVAGIYRWREQMSHRSKLGRGLINAQPHPNRRQLDESEVVGRKSVVTPAATAGIDRNPHLTNSFMMGVGLPASAWARFCYWRSAKKGLRREVGYRPLMAQEGDMRDQEIRAALDRHWAASDANDFEAEHCIYREDAVLEYPQSGERIRGRRNIQITRTKQPSKKRFAVR